MYIVLVHVEVKVKDIEAFKNASMINAQNSLQEPGVRRFDVIQQIDNPSMFVLVEVYNSLSDAAGHKETAHYAIWRDTVADMMAVPRKGVKYGNIYPGEDGW